MGAVLGLSAWGRTQEKLNGANNGGMQPVSQSVTTTFGAPAAGGLGAAAGNFSNAPADNFGASAGGFGAPTQSGFGQVVTGFGGKPAPVEPPR